MSVNCSYHPGVQAAHTCPKCGANFCSSCIIKKEGEYHGLIKNFFLCPQCNIYTQKIAGAYSIEPFWKRFPQIFAYPLHVRPLILILVISLIQTFLAYSSIFIFFIQFICFGIVVTYANIVLHETSQGNKKPPPVDLVEIQSNFKVVFAQIAIILLLALLNNQIKIPLPIFSIAVFFMLPAIIIMLAITKSFFAAIMPHVFIRLAWRMGWPYLAMWFLLSLLFSAPAVILQVYWNILPESVSVFLAIASAYYYMMVAYHLMGYLMFQYHERIGYEVAYDGEEEEPQQKVYSAKVAAKAADQSNNQLLNRTNIFLKDGNHDDAISLIQRETGGKPTEPVVAERYFNLLRIKQRSAELAVYGKDYIPLLIKTNQKAKACEVYLECLSINENFLDGGAENIFIAAKTLNEFKYHTHALNAFQKFIREAPDHPLVPNAYFFIAMLLNEQLQEREKALQILQYLSEKFPFHENASFVTAYLKKMQQA